MSVEPSFMQNDWQFDERVTNQFDEMLSRSIPHYELMRQCCFETGKPFLKPHANLVDLGCSRGEAVKLFLDQFGATAHYSLVETSTPMFNAVSARYQSWVDAGAMHIYNSDLREFYPVISANLTLSVLTLMFIPIEYRQGLVRKVFQSTVTGGAFILVEKVLGSSAEIDQHFVRTYYALKRTNGYSLEEINRKRLALEGRLVPVTGRWNEELLRGAGFQQVDCFWRWMNFAAWIAIKD